MTAERPRPKKRATSKRAAPKRAAPKRAAPGRRVTRPHGAAALAPPAATRTPPALPTTLLGGPPDAQGRPPRCRHCLRTPAIDVRPRITVGVLIAHATDEAEGPFCRPCGTARARALTSRTLLVGWGAPLAPFANVRTLIHNARVLRGLKALPVPKKGPLPRYAERPFDPGKPVYRRAGMIGLAGVLLAILLIFGLVAFVNEFGPVQLEGDCVDLAENRRSLELLDGCGPPADGRIEEIVTGERSCERPPDAEVALPDYPNNSRACVTLLDRGG